MLFRLKRHAEAIEQFEQALALDPNSKPAQDYLRQVSESKR